MSKRSTSEQVQGLPNTKIKKDVKDSDFANFNQGIQNSIFNNIDVFNYQLREPVSSIFASLPLLSENINNCDTEKASKNLQIIYEKAYIMLKNINNISLASKIYIKSEIQVSAVDFSSLVESVATSAGLVLPDYVKIEQEVQGGGVVKGNSGILSHALFNLILNSIEYRTEDNVEIKIDLKITQNNCILTYIDNSIGIKSDIAPFIFDFYYTENPYVDGEASTKIGLGLYIARAAIENAGGTIFMHSEFSGGVKYAVTIPLCKEQTEQMLKSKPSDFVLNRYSEMFVQLCEYCTLPDLA